MGNQVTIKLDSRVFYVLVAVVAVLGIFGIGWWLGTQLSGGDQSAAVTQQPAAAAPAVDSSVQLGGAGAGQVPFDAQPAPMLRASPPVSLEEVPVGQGEARLWIDDLGESNWTFDFGAIAADAVVEQDFVIRNLGTAELVIENVSAGCGCTAALVTDSTVAPGEMSTVRVQYDPRVNRDFGKFVKNQVRIQSNDPVAPLVEFNVTADVAPQ